MKHERRIELYTRVLTRGRTVDGIYRLTPKQRSRVRHKFNRHRHLLGEELFDRGGWDNRSST